MACDRRIPQQFWSNISWLVTVVCYGIMLDALSDVSSMLSDAEPEVASPASDAQEVGSFADRNQSVLCTPCASGAYAATVGQSVEAAAEEAPDSEEAALYSPTSEATQPPDILDVDDAVAAAAETAAETAPQPLEQKGESVAPLWVSEGHLWVSFLSIWEVRGSKQGLREGSWGTI